MSDETLLPEVTDPSSPNLYLQIACSLSILAATSLSYKFIEPNGGTDLKSHAIYVASAFVLILFLPTTIASYIFTELTVTFIGCIYPIYRATKAVCTPEENDDKEWLQYWMIGGVLFMLTTWVDDVISTEKANDVWLGCLLFVFLWLYFPLTCGAKLFYEKITEPILGPKLKPLHAQMNNFILAVYQMLANATHLYAVWFVFLFLPAGLKRVVAIAIGTVYPFVSSVTAAATEDVEDDTYWLTYWAVYGCLFVIMDLSEKFLGRIPGFYTLIIFSTIYLMLPMFRGADKVFRKILVPLAGLQELLFLRDSIVIKKQMLKDLDPERAKLVSKSIAKFFSEEGEAASDPVALQSEMMSSWSSLKMPKFKMPFGKSEEKPTEATPLV